MLYFCIWVNGNIWDLECRCDFETVGVNALDVDLIGSAKAMICKEYVTYSNAHKLAQDVLNCHVYTWK